MGTNVYLHRDVCGHCHRGEDAVHVGKSSGGWPWLWRGYRTEWDVADHALPHPILSGADWWRYLDTVGVDELRAELRDEYGKRMSVADLRNWVEGKREHVKCHRTPGEDTFPDGEEEISFRGFS